VLSPKSAYGVALGTAGSRILERRRTYRMRDS
jgi:hypothetical protein